MDDRERAEQLLQEHFRSTAALIALMLKNLRDDERTRKRDAVRKGTGKVELRNREESNETKLVLVPTDGSEPLGWRVPDISPSGLSWARIQYPSKYSSANFSPPSKGVRSCGGNESGRR